MTNLQLSPQEAAQELLIRRKARKSLIDFTNYTYPDFQAGEHHKAIAEVLEAVERGDEKRVMIFAPPRHTKSELASRRFPAWYLARNPKNQLIFSTYAQDFALDFGRDVRGIVNGEEYQSLFPEVQLAADSKAANRWHTNQGGISVFVGVDGPITGRGAHVAIIDDPFKNRKEADSETTRDTVWKWYSSTLRTRLMPGGAIVLILTRWHEDDLAGRLLERDGRKEDGGLWNVIEFPAVADEGTDHETALWPEWYPLEALKQIQDEIGARDWSALYQQRPQPDEGTFFQRDWFRWYDPDKPPQSLNRWICSDYAVTDSGGDWTEHGVFGVDPDDNLFVLDWWSGQTTADVWIDVLLDLANEHKPLAVFGETGPIRRSVEPFLLKRMRERRVYSRLEWISRSGDKAAMARAFQARASMGKVYLPKNDQGEALLEQLLTFPAGKHDDKVDVCALMGMALDETHPATITPIKAASKKRDYFREREDSSWKTA